MNIFVLVPAILCLLPVEYSDYILTFFLLPHFFSKMLPHNLLYLHISAALTQACISFENNHPSINLISPVKEMEANTIIIIIHVLKRHLKLNIQFRVQHSYII